MTPSSIFRFPFSVSQFSSPGHARAATICFRLVRLAPIFLLTVSILHARARDFGVPFQGVPGEYNAITDVPGVWVGHTTLFEGEAVRTGVTAILPRGRTYDPVYAGWHVLNGNGEMTGLHWVRESGFMESPVLMTNTHSIGPVHAGSLIWMKGNAYHDGGLASLPVIAETWDGGLNDINGFHVRPGHAVAALDAASSGPVAEGNVGGGTGMVCMRFKGGIGTASRRIEISDIAYTVGVLVQANFGRRLDLTIAGIPVGRIIGEDELMPVWNPTPAEPSAGHQAPPSSPSSPPFTLSGPGRGRARAIQNDTDPSTARTAHAQPLPSPRDKTAHALRSLGEGGPVPRQPIDAGSIICVIATDVPLLPHQLDRVAQRGAIGVGRVGGTGKNSSGDFFLAFSTANPGAWAQAGHYTPETIPNDAIDGVFDAAIEATEEAVINALVAAETMTGRNGNTVYELPEDRLAQILEDRLPVPE